MKLVVDIQKSLGGFRLETAFTAEDGVTGLLGASGCGKSMTLKCIAGVVTPDEGHISLDGVTLFDSAKHINLRPQQRHVGYLFQNYALFPNMTVQQNILTGLRHENDRAVRASACAEAIRLFGLSGLEKRRPSQLSGGQQQRVALARILVNRPQLLMLDEPFSALDTHLREKLQLEMKDLLATYGGPA
ncbi:MAG: ATP-binding cassette domain-containing protein, partial [Clostridium sp.]|nr:ATP-binding cassette domain-containing protein [Clostridium sp.]